MKSLYKIIPFALVLMIQNICISCENLIEVDVPGNQVGSAQVFEDAQTANAALSGLYASLFKSSVLSGDILGPFLGSYTDDLDCYYIGSVNGAMNIYQNLQIPSNTEITSVWNNAYQQIYMANAIINGVENSASISSTDKNRIKGETLLMRSIIYFYLQQLFGDIPYTTTTDYQVNQSMLKTSSQEVLNKLEKDLKTVTGLLKEEYRSTERIYPNRQVANLMLAKVLMIKKEWNNAEVVLRELTQNPLYQFQNDVTKVFNKNGTHILWQLKPANAGDTVVEAGFYYFSDSVPNSYALSQDLINTFSPVDLRKQNWMSPVVFNQHTYYRNEKYKNRVPGENNSEYSIVFRLEEAYLLLAETLAEQNKVAEAVPFINATRQRAGLSALPATISKADCLNEVLLEDRKEFFAEMGHRFLDLKRTGNLDILSQIKPNWKSYHNLWPLPQSDLLTNPNLNPQNLGY